MAQTRTPTETIAFADADQPLDRVVERVSRSRTRLVVEHDGVPVAAVIPAEELARLDRLDAEWEAGWEALDEIGAAFKDVDPEEIEHEVAKALAEVRAEMRAERTTQEAREGR